MYKEGSRRSWAGGEAIGQPREVTPGWAGMGGERLGALPGILGAILCSSSSWERMRRKGLLCYVMLAAKCFIWRLLGFMKSVCWAGESRMLKGLSC